MSEQKPTETKLLAEQSLPPGWYSVQMDAETLIVISRDGRLMNTDYPLACSRLLYTLSQAAIHGLSAEVTVSDFSKSIPACGGIKRNSKTLCPTCGSELPFSNNTLQDTESVKVCTTTTDSETPPTLTPTKSLRREVFQFEKTS